MTTYRCPACGQEYQGSLNGTSWCSGHLIVGKGLFRRTGQPRHDPEEIVPVPVKPSPLTGPYWTR